MIEKTVTTSKRYEMTQLALNMFDTEMFLKTRQDMKNCWNCHKPLADSEGGRLSLVMTNKGNKIVCTQCAKGWIEQGDIQIIDRTPKATPLQESDAERINQ